MFIQTDRPADVWKATDERKKGRQTDIRRDIVVIETAEMFKATKRKGEPATAREDHRNRPDKRQLLAKGRFSNDTETAWPISNRK